MAPTTARSVVMVMTDGDKQCTGGSESGPPWEFKIQLWEKTDDACGDRRAGHTGETFTDTGFSWQEGDELDVLNDVLYDLRGVKSKWELAWVDYIRPLDEVEEP